MTKVGDNQIEFIQKFSLCMHVQLRTSTVFSFQARFSRGLTTSLITNSLRTRYTPSEDSPYEDSRFLLLWLIEITLRVWGTIRYIIATIRRHTNEDFAGYDSLDSVFLTLQSIGDSAQAFCSCMLFCVFDRETRELIRGERNSLQRNYVRYDAVA